MLARGVFWDSVSLYLLLLIS